jgi:hypothetical protein
MVNTDSIESIDNSESKYRSRKWYLTLLIIAICTIGTFVPPILSVWVLDEKTPLVILSGSEYVTLITLIISVYFGANVWEKRETARANCEFDRIHYRDNKIDSNEDGEL